MPEEPDAAARLAAIEAVMSALAHAARRQILLTIHFRGGAVNAGDIAARFAHAWPTTTRHLRVLEAAGLIRQEKKGRLRVYLLDRDRLAIVAEWLTWFAPVAEAPAESDAAQKPKTTPGARTSGTRRKR